MNVFAVWQYANDMAIGGYVELNSVLIATILGGTEKEVESALAYLTRPDPKSRSKEEDGRRLVREGQFQYRIVNWEHYQRIRNEEEKREYNRLKMQEYRAKKKKEDKVRPANGPATMAERVAEAQNWNDGKCVDPGFEDPIAAPAEEIEKNPTPPAPRKMAIIHKREVPEVKKPVSSANVNAKPVQGAVSSPIPSRACPHDWFYDSEDDRVCKLCAHTEAKRGSKWVDVTKRVEVSAPAAACDHQLDGDYCVKCGETVCPI